jgi:lipid-binding SYLF domain-containing protein
MFQVLFLVAAAALSAGCSTAPRSSADRAELHADVLSTIATFKAADPSILAFFDNAKGYAVFPSIGKGGIGIGGAYGRGELFEGGEVVGHCDMSQATIGFQLGGQVYSEIVFFETPATLGEFKTGNVEFSAQASAVAATAGAAAKADYDSGVAVFIHSTGGLMYEASIGGQKFSYAPK